MLDAGTIVENMAFTLYVVTCVSPPIREVHLQLHCMFSLLLRVRMYMYR